MLRCVVIGAGAGAPEQFGHAISDAVGFRLTRIIEHYPAGEEVGRALRAQAPQVVFLCADDLRRALEVRAEIEHVAPGLPAVAFGRHVSQEVLLELMKAGVRDFLSVPLQPGALRELAARLEGYLVKNPLSFDATDAMYTFLPAKPGVGTSTLALNISMALARRPGHKVLLADFDLSSGLIAFMLKISGPYSVVDAALRAEDLDEHLWPQIVHEKEKLHVLPAGRTEPGARIQSDQVRRLVDFARRNYSVICADLSGNLEKYSIRLMEESKQIFLVTTPEIPPLHLAQERCNLLRKLDLGDRISILVNRWHKRCTIPVRQIEELLGVKVREVFPNNYHGVHQALVAARPIEEKSDLGRRCAAFAERLAKIDAAESEKTQRRFLETFSVIPPRYSLPRESS